jgi:catechol 2,3-dioxygenase-like lactoylglutathione lyase family enzyme
MAGKDIDMLKDKDSVAIVAVTDMARARAFYADALGLDLVETDDNVSQFRTGNTRLVLYISEFAGTNKANAVAWGVGDEIDSIVVDLAAKGVKFEHYPALGLDYRDGVHSAGAFKAVWFKDPDGNILHLNSM